MTYLYIFIPVNEEIAAIDSATAAETVADGVKRAKIKEAEGEAEAIETSLEKNPKIVIPTGSDLVNVIGEMAGILPLEK